MFRLLFFIFISTFFINQSQSQDFKKLIVGKWEDNNSNNENSFQLLVQDSINFVFAKVLQANISDSTVITRNKIYQYKWLSNNILSYGKLPDSNPLKAKLFPPKYSLMRIDKLNNEMLKVSLSDKDFTKNQLDSIINSGNYEQYFGERFIHYNKLDLLKEKNKVLVMGLWEDQQSNDSTSYQFYIQKKQFGLLKIKKEDRKKPTMVKPNKAYDYNWINGNVFYYKREAASGFVKRQEILNKYSLIRIDEVDRKNLTITFSTRPFNKAGLKYIIEEDDLEQYFAEEQVTYKRIKVVKKM
ncbi:MAG: hypothetical protein MK207_12865 [Saprospiraceae bacterium]|nr:hypothetical protein [Saprospiraceae bacterium]